MIPGSPGLFDLPAPALQWLDKHLLSLPEAVRVLLCAALGSVVSMTLYALTSPQSRLAAVKERIRESQATLAGYAGDFPGALPLLRLQMGLHFRHLGLTLLPALLGSLPVLFLLPWLSLRFGRTLPEPGTAVAVTVAPATAPLLWEPATGAAPRAGRWEVVWPQAEHPTTLSASDGTVLLRLPLAQPEPSFTRSRWWHLFFGNLVGYLPDGTPIDSIELELPRRKLIPAAPSWLGGWEALFFGGTLMLSVGIRRLFRLH